jgi:salicylate hydroxylase
LSRHIHDVVIAGGGLGGLAAAYLLRNAGMHVTVLEQAAEFGEVGAGLQTAPNASRILINNGLRPQLEKIKTAPTDQVRRRWKDGKILATRPLGDALWKEFGAPYWHFHRADLHNVFLEACADPFGPGTEVELYTSSGVVDVELTDESQPTAITADGRRFPGDVLIGADGIHSQVRSAVGLSKGSLIYSGQMVFRALIPGHKLQADPVTRFLFDRFHSSMWYGPHQHLVHYFLRGGEVLNVGASVQRPMNPEDAWTSETSVEEFVDAFAGWDDRLLTILSKAEGPILKWALFTDRRNPVWVTGHVGLLGDAAHAMTPNHAQGASQAIEDAAVLAEELCVVSARDIDTALIRYNARRAKRAGILQEASVQNMRFYQMPDGPQQEERDRLLQNFQGESDVTYEWLWRGTPLRDLDPVSPEFAFIKTGRSVLAELQEMWP